MTSLPTVWVLGDQLNRRVGPLASYTPGGCRVLMIESSQKVASKRWHRQRLHMMLSAMRHFAQELVDEGFDVDYRRAANLSTGVDEHRRQYQPSEIVAMSPMSFDGARLLDDLGVRVVENEQFLCSYQRFAEWAEGRRRLTMEDFYRWQRMRLDVLMDIDGSPIGGQWNFDHDNRLPPPKNARQWPGISLVQLDDIDREVIDELPPSCWGDPPHGLWPVTRAQAVQRLDEFVRFGLAEFGPYEDAMLGSEWKLAHSTLAAPLNIGLLHPGELVEAALAAWRRGDVPINSVEGFIRQVIGWREFVWGVYWQWMPGYRHHNTLAATRPLPPAFTGRAPTSMRCLSSVLAHLNSNGYTHHIERLMVLGNVALLAGVDPQQMVDWMWAGFVDGAEWVMLPNVIGMALHADGGLMATKPYAAGGSYVNTMSDHCRSCVFDPKKRTGPTACPLTTLYWDFLARNQTVLGGNHRLSKAYGGMRRLNDLTSVRERADEVLRQLDAGTL